MYSEKCKLLGEIEGGAIEFNSRFGDGKPRLSSSLLSTTGLIL